MPRPRVALMVLNWNGADLLQRHLPAVLDAASHATTLDARVYVIDNASEDDSRPVIEGFEGVDLIAFDDNRRLHAYNRAAAMVECDAFMMLNNDVSPHPDVVDQLWDTLAADERIFAVGGEVVDLATGEIDSGPTALRWDGGWTPEPTALAGAARQLDVAYVSGGAGLYRRSMFLALGGFWDSLPGLYWEDLELGLHAWLCGWRSVFLPDVRFDHASGSTVKRALNPRIREFLTYQNVRLTHLSLLLEPGDLREYLFRELRRSVRKPYYYATFPTLLPYLPAIRRRRRELRRRCGAVTVAQLQAHWTPEQPARQR